MFSEDILCLVEEMGFQSSSELSSTDGCWEEVDREGIPDDCAATWKLQSYAPRKHSRSSNLHQGICFSSQSERKLVEFNIPLDT